MTFIPPVPKYPKIGTNDSPFRFVCPECLHLQETLKVNGESIESEYLKDVYFYIGLTRRGKLKLLKFTKETKNRLREISRNIIKEYPEATPQYLANLIKIMLQKFWIVSLFVP